jgi:hypothetical protein
MMKIGAINAPIAQAFLKGVECHIEADLVPILETVSDGSSHAGHSNGYPLDPVLFYACREGFSTGPHNPKRRIIEFRRTSMPVHHQPNLPGSLCSQVMELKSREQTDDSLGNTSADTGEGMVFGQRCVRTTVEAATQVNEVAAFCEALNALS